MKPISRNWALAVGFVSTFGAILAMTGGGVLVASATQPPNHRVTICHATGADSNPYVVLTPDIASAGFLQGGHDGHTGPIWVSGDQSAHQKWGDIIPPYQYVRADGTTFVFAGLNWTAQGQAIWDDGCAAPGQTTPTRRPRATRSPGATPSAGASLSPGAAPIATPPQSGGVSAATAGGGVLAATGATVPGQNLGLFLIVLGLCVMTVGAIAWKRRRLR
jgi:hypothetical protein